MLTKVLCCGVNCVFDKNYILYGKTEILFVKIYSKCLIKCEN